MTGRTHKLLLYLEPETRRSLDGELDRLAAVGLRTSRSALIGDLIREALAGRLSDEGVAKLSAVRAAWRKASAAMDAALRGE